MSTGGIHVTALLSALILSAAQAPAAHAAPLSFESALSEYRAGRYDAAHAGFLSLAELGDCSSQFNLAAMALHGQGAPKDPGSGAGWLEAAAANGCAQLVGDRLKGVTASLTPEERQRAAAIMARYGPEALHAQGIVNPDFTCHSVQPAVVALAAQAQAPAGARRPELVISALTVGTDGHARDPEILLAFPTQGFAAAAVEAWLNSRFTPAQAPLPVAARLDAQTLFAAEGEPLANTEAFRQALAAAQTGDPAAAYLVGLAGMHDSSLGLSSPRAGQLLFGAARDGNADAQYWVARQLRASAACHPRADGAVWLRHAADGGSPAAQVLLAHDLLAGTPNAEQAAQARTLLGQAAHANSYYARKHAIALLAASPVDAVRDPPAALELARQLAAGDIRSDPQMFEAVAAAYAANGDFREASAQQQLAEQKARDLGWSTSGMTERLEAYRHGKPWRGDLFASP